MKKGNEGSGKLTEDKNTPKGKILDYLIPEHLFSTTNHLQPGTKEERLKRRT